MRIRKSNRFDNKQQRELETDHYANANRKGSFGSVSAPAHVAVYVQAHLVDRRTEFFLFLLCFPLHYLERKFVKMSIYLPLIMIMHSKRISFRAIVRSNHHILTQ